MKLNVPRNLNRVLFSISLLSGLMFGAQAWAHSLSPSEMSEGSKDNGVAFEDDQPGNVVAFGDDHHGAEVVTNLANTVPGLQKLADRAEPSHPLLDTPVLATPIPGAAWLFISGILSMVAIARRKRIPRN